MKRRAIAISAVLVCMTALLGACGGSGQNSADGKIVVGDLYIGTGPNATQGIDIANGAKLAVEIVNGTYPDLNLPLAKDAGLPNLGGKQVKLAMADTKGDPKVGASAATRLVQSDGAVALFGAFTSAVTATSSMAAERLQVPYVNGASTGDSLTKRGLDWFFRVGPPDSAYAEAFFDLLDQQKSKSPVERVAIFHRNDTYGNDGAEITNQVAEARGYDVVADVKYDVSAPSLRSQVLNVRAAKPDAVFVVSLTDDSILLFKALKDLGYYPPGIMQYGGGATDPAFLNAMGESADGLMTRAAWSSKLENSTSKKVAEMFEEEFNAPLTENSARSFTGMLALLTAINEAGSTAPDEIQQALIDLKISGDELIMPWKGIEFDEDHQNKYATGIVEQLIKGEYQIVFPPDSATGSVRWPMSAAR